MSCCELRKKVIVGIFGIIPEEVCGVPDSSLVDVVQFGEKSPAGHTVVSFRFCPWCGTAMEWKEGGEVIEPPFTIQDQE